MDKTVEEIYIVLDELLANIGLQLEEFDMSFLTQAELYVEMFKVMFPTLVPLLDIDFSQEDVNDVELIQSLLDFLSKYIIKMDLDHISGELITKGDPKHILNFIQLLSEISKMIQPKDEGEEEGEHGQIAENYRNFAAERLNKSAPGTYRLTDQSQNSLEEWKYEKYNSAIGIPGEFHVEDAEGEEMEGAQAEGDSGAEDMGAYSGARGGPYPPMKDKYGQGQKRPGKQESLRNSYSGSRISEVSKSKECSDYEMTAKKLSGVDHQFEDFDPKTDPERQKRLEARMPADAEWNGQYGQYEEEEEDEEIVEEADEDEEDEHTESTAKRHSAHKRSDRPKGSQPREEEKYGHEGEEEEYEEEEQYEEEEGEGEGEEYEQEDIDQGEEDYQSYPGRKVSKESEEYEGAEYFQSDPINYQSNKRGSSRAQQQEYEEEEGEEEQEEQEEQYEEEEQEEYEDQREAQDMIQEHYDEEDEEGEHMRDEVIEDEAEYYRQQYEAQKMAQARKSKKATRPSTAKPAAYKPGKVEYRPLRPTTAVTYMSHQSVSQARPSQPKPKVKKIKKKIALPMEPMQPMHPKMKPKSKLLKKTKQPKQPRSTSSKNHITEERISERSRESTGQDVRGLQGAQQAGSRRVTSGGSTREENSMRRNQEQREPSVRYGESLKRRRLTGQGTMQKTGGSIRIKGDTLKKAYEDQQKMLYYNIRDSKLNYLKKIHTIIYQLEKEKIKEERELQRNYIKAQEEATVNILLSIKQSYQEKLDVLRQGYKNEKNERKVNDLAQHTFLKTLKHELRLDQMKEIARLKDRLSQEKMRFDLMTGDEAYLERKLAQLYQK